MGNKVSEREVARAASPLLLGGGLWGVCGEWESGIYTIGHPRAYSPKPCPSSIPDHFILQSPSP